jgi:hypothetical protein
MSKRRLSKTFLSISVLSATTEAGSFPKENVVDRTSPQRAWRSTTVGSDQRLVIDLGAVQTSITCYLDWVNFGTFKYQESADGSTGWSDIGTTRTVAKDPMHGVYRRVDDITMSSKRYLGILIPAQTPVDNASYFRIGTFCVPTSIYEPDAEKVWYEYPLEYSVPDSNIIVNSFPTGRSERIKLGTLQPLFISFALQSESLTNIRGEHVEDIADMLRDTTQTLWLDFNLGETYQAYLCKKTGELRASVSTPNVNTADFGQILMEVII